MPATTFHFNDPRFAMVATVPNGNSLQAILGHPFKALLEAVADLTITGGVNTITVTGTSYLMTTTNGRTYAAVLNVAADSRALTTSAFTLAELLSHNPVVEGVIKVLASGADTISVTFT